MSSAENQITPQSSSDLLPQEPSQVLEQELKQDLQQRSLQQDTQLVCVEGTNENQVIDVERLPEMDPIVRKSTDLETEATEVATAASSEAAVASAEAAAPIGTHLSALTAVTPAASEEAEEEQPLPVDCGLRLNERTILKLQEAFSLFDHDCDGRLSLHQTATMMRAVGLGLTEKNIAEILSEAPTAKIDFGTFLTSMADHLRAVRENRAEEEAEAIKNAFQLIEEINRGHKHDDEGGRGGERGRGGGSGTISRRRLTRLLTRVGEKLNKHEIDELLDDVGLGEISPDDEIRYDVLIEKIFEDY